MDAHRLGDVQDHDAGLAGLVRRRGGLEDLVELDLVGHDGGLAVVGTVLLGAVLEDVAGKRDLADVLVVSRVRTVLVGQRDEVAVEVLAAALVEVGRGRRADDDVVAVGDVSSGQTGDVRLSDGGVAVLVCRARVGLGNGVGHDLEVLLKRALEQRKLAGGRRRGDAAEHACSLVGGVETHRHVDLGLGVALGGLDDAVMVLEHDDALDLGVERGGLGLLVATLLVDGGAGNVRIDVGILEQARVEVAEQQALGGGAEVGVRLLLAEVGDHVLVGGDEQGRVVAAAHLVDADLDGLGGTLGRVPNAAVLEAPAGGHARALVVQDCPVGARRALEAVLVAQELGDLVLGEAGAHELAILLVLIVGDRIGRHDGASAAGLAVELEAAVHERDHEGLEVIARVDGELAAVGVALAAALAGALSGPVLDHGDERAGAPALVLAVLVDRGLQAVDEGAADVAGEGRVLAEGAVEARPARVGGNVSLRAEEHRDAHLAHI